MCMGEGMAVESKVMRLAVLERLREEISCKKGLDDLHEEYYQLTKDDTPWWAGSYVTYTPSWSNTTYLTYSKPKPPEQVRREELEALLYECQCLAPRCRWKHDDANDDV